MIQYDNKKREISYRDICSLTIDTEHATRLTDSIIYEIEGELKLFYCYAPEDQQLLEELDVHLEPLKQTYQLSTSSGHKLHTAINWEMWSWYQDKSPEQLAPLIWEESIDFKHNPTDLLVILGSMHFLASDYIHSVEMRRVLKLHAQNWHWWQMLVISLDTADWKETPLATVSTLPTNGRPVTAWPSHEQAFQNIATGLATVVDQIWLARGSLLLYDEQYEEALTVYTEALRVNPRLTEAWNGKGSALRGLKQYNEALQAYDEALRLDPTYCFAWNNKSHLFKAMGQMIKAWHAFKQARTFGISSTWLDWLLEYPPAPR